MMDSTSGVRVEGSLNWWIGEEADLDKRAHRALRLIIYQRERYGREPTDQTGARSENPQGEHTHAYLNPCATNQCSFFRLSVSSVRDPYLDRAGQGVACREYQSVLLAPDEKSLQ